MSVPLEKDEKVKPPIFCYTEQKGFPIITWIPTCQYSVFLSYNYVNPIEPETLHKIK